MAGLRDVLIHDYMGISLKIVWNVVQNELPNSRL
ncbi:HepT-like ribonuclease domain-containing protein [Desulfosporosinus youngiae]|nr:HepT-like ribonuclease domain-containing protein [Desulfosporosinus youngiae]